MHHTIYHGTNKLYERQKQLYHAWIPHELLLSAIVKKLVSIDTPLTFIALRKYLKCVFREIPFEIYQSLIKNRRNNHKRCCYDCIINWIIPFGIFISITTSLLFAWYGVYEASYNYPGGVAITLLPKIVRSYNTNMTKYDHYKYAGTYCYNSEYDEIICPEEYSIISTT